MTDEPKQNRITIMMTDKELTAIENWQFENRLSSGGEAIRRLIQIGLNSKLFNSPEKADKD